MTLALELLKKELVATTLMAQIQSEVEADYQKNQRRYMLTEQLKKIKKELGLEKDDKDALIEKFQSRVKGLHMNENVSSVCDPRLRIHYVLAWLSEKNCEVGKVSRVEAGCTGKFQSRVKGLHLNEDVSSVCRRLLVWLARSSISIIVVEWLSERRASE